MSVIYMLMWTNTDGLGSENTWYAETVAMATDMYDGWSLMAGIMTVTEKQAAHTSMYLRLFGPHISMNVFYDDISVEPLPKSCENLVVNSDFEAGDSSFWRPTMSSTLTFYLYFFLHCIIQEDRK